ncbi:MULTISPECIES: plasmid stabilization protein [Streptomyces]|uniref:plasmid stabilization protein n=1 Tax=Streptomyces TaxID=1883 RepID=UPI0022495FF1|nr:plasmid stabilization protein [Streptomyces sp. JHD 1]MCX2969139.1 plasmid stabilization protein [Streptomyces sp. JHD 1]
MAKQSSSKRERQYEHIKESEKKRGGGSAKRAGEIASRTMNKQKAQAGETRGAQRSRSGGGASASARSADQTREQLYAEAKKRDVKGRSSMNKSELRDALGR